MPFLIVCRLAATSGCHLGGRQPQQFMTGKRISKLYPSESASRYLIKTLTNIKRFFLCSTKHNYRSEQRLLFSMHANIYRETNTKRIATSIHI